MTTPGTLTDAQLDGVACVVCADETAPMRPVGSLDGCQVFACTSHVIEEVPACVR